MYISNNLRLIARKVLAFLKPHIYAFMAIFEGMFAYLLISIFVFAQADYRDCVELPAGRRLDWLSGCGCI